MPFFSTRPSPNNKGLVSTLSFAILALLVLLSSLDMEQGAQSQI